MELTGIVQAIISHLHHVKICENIPRNHDDFIISMPFPALEVIAPCSWAKWCFQRINRPCPAQFLQWNRTGKEGNSVRKRNEGRKDGRKEGKKVKSDVLTQVLNVKMNGRKGFL